MADKQLSAFTRSIAGNSAYSYVTTPYTSCGRSQKSGAKSEYGMNKTTSDWKRIGRQGEYQDDIYSCFSKQSE